MQPSVPSTARFTDTPTFVADAIREAIQRTDVKLTPFSSVFPGDNTLDGQYHAREALDDFPEGGNFGWTTSFWTGQLWLAYELTNDDRYRQTAEHQVRSFKDRIERKVDCDTHDLGFLYSLSCVAATHLSPSEAVRRDAREAALDAAGSLCARYHRRAGIIQAWGDLTDPQQRGRIIIDCLMNLPLLYWASAQTGEAEYAQIATRHAEQARQYLVRPDHSTYHTYYFDPETGRALRGDTHQGFSDDSCWARGQAWGIYGFALAFRFTGNHTYLDTAVALAEYFQRHVPSSGVAYWDLSFGEPSLEPWDASASAIAACGLLEIAQHTEDAELRAKLTHRARQTTQALFDLCAARNADPSNALLLHAVYHRPKNWGVDEANLFGDYFYLEALARLNGTSKGYW